MNVASLELCKELYGLSGWAKLSDTPYGVESETLNWYRHYDDNTVEPHVADSDTPDDEYICPAYDLGYLLLKLPNGYVVYRASSGMYRAGRLILNDNDELVIEPFNWEQYVEPENAAAKLCIALFKQGILKREENRDE